MMIGLIVATALWNSVHLINTEAKKAYADAKIISSLSSEKILISENGLDFNDNFFGELRKIGWLVTPHLAGELEIETNAETEILKIIGMDPLSLGQQTLSATFPQQLTPSEFLRGTRVILAGPETAKKLQGIKQMGAVQRSNSLPEGFALMDISLAQRILEKENRLTSLQIVGPIPDDILAISDRDLKIHLNENSVDLSRLTKSFHLNLTAFGFLSYIVALFIVYSTINLAFEQRKGILKGLRSLGISSISIARLMLLEILMISTMSGILGVVSSYFLASILLPDVAMTLNGLFGASLADNLTIDGMFWFTSLCISILGALCSSAPVLWKSLSLSPIESAKKIAWYEKTKQNMKYQLLTSSVIFVLIIFLFLVGSGIIIAFLLLGSILVVTTLLLPIFLWGVITQLLKYEFKSPLVRWFIADCKQQIGSLSVSLMALLLALAVNIGVGGMVESFRKTFIGWLDQRLASELYIKASNSIISEEIQLVLKEEVEAILPIVKVSQNVFDEPSDIYGFIPHVTYSKYWPLISQSSHTWQEIKQKKGLIINEQLSRRKNLEVFDIIEFESKRGDLIRLQILGVYSDYGNPKGQVMLPLELFRQYFPNEPELSFALRVPKSKISTIKQILGNQFSNEDMIITDQTEIKNLSTSIFEKTFTITAALSILTLGVAGIALFASITTLGDNRYAQLAPLWCIGMQRKTLAILEALRSISLATLTFIFAIPAGLAVVFILTNYINLEAFGWKLPIFFFPKQWLSLCLMTVIITFIATCLYSIKMAMATPAELLKASQYDT